jgi:hypothetical protein
MRISGSEFMRQATGPGPLGDGARIGGAPADYLLTSNSHARAARRIRPEGMIGVTRITSEAELAGRLADGKPGQER